ncbi:unnamed protein product [Effrenium voratum]|nr:unnamed protein product [Effrenium voratum]CAJ1419221.1 unnamed protein product [Effrenium voratum]
MGCNSSTEVEQVVYNQRPQPGVVRSAQGAFEHQVTPRSSWNGRDPGLGRRAPPERSMHERYVRVLEDFMEVVKSEPSNFEKQVRLRRVRSLKPEEAAKPQAKAEARLFQRQPRRWEKNMRPERKVVSRVMDL